MRLWAAAAVFALGCSTPAPAGGVSPDDKEDRGGGSEEEVAKPRLQYRGGPVLHDPVQVHIYWGSYWMAGKGSGEADVLDAFAASVGESSWYAITAEYGDLTGMTGKVVAGDSLVVAEDPGAQVSDRAIRSFILELIEAGDLSWNPEAIYTVFTPPGTVQSTPWGKTCDAICAYHYHFKGEINGVEESVVYAAVPYGECPDGCGGTGTRVQTRALDQMTSSLSHEIAESVTDPHINAWTRPGGIDEIADLCETSFAADFGGGEKYKVQELWSNLAGGCLREATLP